MALSTKLLKGRIKSISNTKKITKAMEMVSAAKMHKAVQNVLASRCYADFAWDILTRVKGTNDPSLHRFLSSFPMQKRELLILITSNRGLCGGYNTQIIQKALAYAQNREREDVICEFITVGKKAREIADRSGKRIVADFPKQDVLCEVQEIFPISHLVFSFFEEKQYNRVMLGYTDFISSLKQIPRIRQILPVLGKDEWLGQIGEGRDEQTPQEVLEYLYEPHKDAVLASLLPRLVEIQIYQAYLESNASEHAARMMAMQNATEAASDLVFDLSLSFNQTRQSNITREIAEISAGKAVLETN